MVLPFFSDTYTYEATLREGENTSVYLVRHIVLGERRVMKLVRRPAPVGSHAENGISANGRAPAGNGIPAEHRADSSASLSSHISNEAQILSGLRYPGIPALYDAAEDEKYVCLIEEYCAGEGLESYLTEHMLPEREIARILAAVCGILSYLHSRPDGPILYLDLKPEHIILSGEKVSLIDYGISRSASAARSGETNPVFGTRDWCSPEAAEGREVTVASDIYSLGRLAEALYRRCPEGKSAAVSGVIMKSLADLPEKRQASVSEWKEAYLTALGQEKGEGGCLSHTVAVTGTERGAGATHVAIALTVYLNRTGRKACYINRSGRTVTGNLVENDATFVQKADGTIYHAGFCGYPERGPAAEEPPLPEGIRVVDCGTDPEKTYDADLIVYVVSSCNWFAGTIDSRAPLSRGTVVVLNPGRRARGIHMSRAIGRKVYGFPPDPDAFALTRDKEKFFRRVEKGLQKERKSGAADGQG